LKVTAGQIYRAKDALNTLAAQKLPVRTGYTVARNARLIAPEFNTIQESFFKVVRENGKADEKNPDLFAVDPGKVKEVQEQIDALMASEIELDIRKVKVDDLGSAELTPTECDALDFMLDNGEPPPAPAPLPPMAAPMPAPEGAPTAA
jgi:hypothetical protein